MKKKGFKDLKDFQQKELKRILIKRKIFLKNILTDNHK